MNHIPRYPMNHIPRYLQVLINLNNWQEDPLSEDDSCKAIACRRDLESAPSARYPSGGLDGKAASVMGTRRAALPVVMARVGPTSDDQAPFCWSALPEEYVHRGQTDCFEFVWTNVLQ